MQRGVYVAPVNDKVHACVHVMMNGRPEWLQELKDALQVDT